MQPEATKTTTSSPSWTMSVGLVLKDAPIRMLTGGAILYLKGIVMEGIVSFSRGLIIFFLAIIALVAELILYFIIGLGAALSGSADSAKGVATIFVILMVVTALVGLGS